MILKFKQNGALGGDARVRRGLPKYQNAHRERARIPSTHHGHRKINRLVLLRGLSRLFQGRKLLDRFEHIVRALARKVRCPRKYAALGLDLIELHACNSLINPAPPGRLKV